MTLSVVTAPNELLVSLREAKAHLRVTHSDHDEIIFNAIVAASTRLDGPNGWLQRSLGAQVLELSLDEFPTCWPYAAVLRCPPIVAVQSVKYTDDNGVEQTLSPSAYRLLGADTQLPRLELAYDQSWPSARSESNAVRIRYSAGYGAANLPANIKQAILIMVADMYEFTQSAEIGQGVSEINTPASVFNLLSGHMVY